MIIISHLHNSYSIIEVEGLTIIGSQSNLHWNNSYKSFVVLTDIIIYYFFIIWMFCNNVRNPFYRRNVNLILNLKSEFVFIAKALNIFKHEECWKCEQNVRLFVQNILKHLLFYLSFYSFYLSYNSIRSKKRFNNKIKNKTLCITVFF